jgi:dinuclear metal center YbgI/SA1388 family protein
LLAKGQFVIQLMEELAPKHYAVPDDKIGLQLGTLHKEISHVLIALDVNDKVVDEAVRLGANLIIAHHAIIFRPLTHLQTDSAAGRLYEKLIKNDIAVYIAHTNLDVAEGGVNDMMADAIGLTGLAPLDLVYTDKLKKLVVFVPEDHLDSVRQALYKAGAGSLGAYSNCSFHTDGIGTFMPEAGSAPFIGTQGKQEQVRELRLETIIPQSIERKAIQAMLKAHPYEEVAYDLYALDIQGHSYGLGRVGKLAEPMTLRALGQLVKAAYNIPAIRFVGDSERKVQKIAVLGGSGGRYVKHALFAGADVLITGDIDYHTAQDAEAAGLCLIDPGHNVEKILKRGVAEYLRGKLQQKKSATGVFASEIDTEPFQFA